MKKLILYVLTLMLCSFLSANEVYDTGYITREQPNQVTFTAREWSDGFFWWMETSSGYRIVQDDDGYYYYAVLDERGEFVASDKKVEIESPPAESSVPPQELPRSKRKSIHLK